MNSNDNLFKGLDTEALAARFVQEFNQGLIDISNINDQYLFKGLILNPNVAGYRKPEIVYRITDMNILASLATSDCELSPRLITAIICKITDRSLLTNLLQSERDEYLVSVIKRHIKYLDLLHIDYAAEVLHTDKYGVFELRSFTDEYNPQQSECKTVTTRSKSLYKDGKYIFSADESVGTTYSTNGGIDVEELEYVTYRSEWAPYVVRCGDDLYFIHNDRICNVMDTQLRYDSFSKDEVCTLILIDHIL